MLLLGVLICECFAHAAVFALRLPHVAHSSLPAFPEGKKGHHACSRCFSRPRVQLVVATSPTVVHAELHRSHASAVHDLALVWLDSRFEPFCLQGWLAVVLQEDSLVHGALWWLHQAVAWSLLAALRVPYDTVAGTYMQRTTCLGVCARARVMCSCKWLQPNKETSHSRTWPLHFRSHLYQLSNTELPNIKRFTLVSFNYKGIC